MAYSKRSTVLACNAAVATSNPTATNIGIQILKAGGNAADAAVGVAAALNVLDYGNTGLGGDCFALFYNAKTKTVSGINGSGRSPAKLSLKLLKENGISKENGFDSIPHESAFSVTVPGAAAGWIDTIERHGSGKLSLREILNPAIELAENGYPVHKLTSYFQKKNIDKLKRNHYSFGDDLLINGKAAEHGQVICNLNLANTFKILAADGKKGFYEGPIAQAIVDTIKGGGGCLTLDDMKEHYNTYEDPISTTYHGVRIWEMPPNGQGLVALMGLNIVEGFDLKNDSRMSAECLHKMIESTQLAFADGLKYIADPSKSEVPIATLLSKERASNRRKLIDMNSASSRYHSVDCNPGDDTVYFSIVDKYGNACSFINSIYVYNGSGFVPKDCGFILQSRGNNFSLEPNHRNCVEPRKRAYHTIIPGMATHESNDELYATFGVMGGFMQPQGHIQVLSSLIDFNMDTQEAICLPRYCVMPGDDGKPVVYLEEDIPQESIVTLKDMGHNVKVLCDLERVMFGGAQVIQIKYDQSGRRVLWCGSESRQDGCAIGF